MWALLGVTFAFLHSRASDKGCESHPTSVSPTQEDGDCLLGNLYTMRQKKSRYLGAQGCWEGKQRGGLLIPGPAMGLCGW